VINTASIQFIPAVMVGIRASLGSRNPADFVIVSILSTSTALMAGLILNKHLEKMPIFKE
jgi:spore maturation protein A